MFSQVCSFSGGFVPNSCKMNQNHQDREMWFWISLTPHQILTSSIKKMHDHWPRLLRIFCALENALLTEFFNLSAMYYEVLAGRWFSTFFSARPCNVITVVKGTCEWSNLIIPRSAAVPSGYRIARERQRQDPKDLFYPETAQVI